MMKIRSGVILAAVLSLASTKVVEYHPEFHLMQNSTDPVAPVIPTFKFWSNLQSFSWGLTLGIPGSTMHNKVEKCWYDNDKFWKQIDIAK